MSERPQPSPEGTGRYVIWKSGDGGQTWTIDQDYATYAECVVYLTTEKKAELLRYRIVRELTIHEGP